MAEIQDNTTKSKPRWLMGCFGFSRAKKKLKLSHEHMDIDMVKTGSLGKKSRWISWSKFRLKKSAAGKTVPVDATVSDNFNEGSKIQSFKLTKKVSSKKYRWSTGVNPSKIPAAVPAAQATNNLAHTKRRSMTTKAIILESGEMDYSNSGAKDDTCQKPTSQKKEKKITGSSKPGSPPVKKYSSNRTTALLPHSAPFSKKQKAINAGDDNFSGIKPGQETDGKFDPVIGMSIVMVALVIMLLWGKLGAILCTSACFYMVPRFRKVTNSNVIEKMGSDSDGPDLNSEEQKKKVVLEGLLQRNHGSVAGIL